MTIIDIRSRLLAEWGGEPNACQEWQRRILMTLLELHNIDRMKDSDINRMKDYIVNVALSSR